MSGYGFHPLNLDQLGVIRLTRFEDVRLINSRILVNVGIRARYGPMVGKSGGYSSI